MGAACGEHYFKFCLGEQIDRPHLAEALAYRVILLLGDGHVVFRWRPMSAQRY